MRALSIRQPYAEQIPAVVVRLGNFLVCHGRVTMASPYVRRYTHILALRNAEWVCDPVCV